MRDKILPVLPRRRMVLLENADKLLFLRERM
jgi:hypothetical protein